MIFHLIATYKSFFKIFGIKSSNLVINRLMLKHYNMNMELLDLFHLFRYRKPGFSKDRHSIVIK